MRRAHRLVIAAILVIAVGGSAGPALGQTGDDTSARGYLSANGLLQRGMNELAVAEYRAFLKSHPEHDRLPHARYGLGVALHRLGMHAEAIHELRGLVDLPAFEFAPAAGVLEAQCRFATGDFKEAAGPLERLVARYPGDELADDAAAMLVEARYRAGSFAEAAKAAGAFADTYGDSGRGDRAAYFAGLSRIKLGDEAAAAAVLASVHDRWPGSPLAERALLLAAQCAHRAGDLAAAESAYRRVLERENGTLAADALLGIATLRQIAGKPREAKDLLDRLLNEHDSSPRAAAALLERGRALLELNDPAAARTDFIAYAERGDAEADRGAYWLAKAEAGLGEFGKASETLKAELSREPSAELAPLLSFDLAGARLQAGDETGAAEALQTFMDSYAGHELAPAALETWATLQHRRGEHRESTARCEEFRRLFADHPLRARVDLLVAENAFLRGDLETADRAYGEFMARHASDGRASLAGFRLGCVRFRRGDMPAAEPLLAAAAERAGDDPVYRPALLYLGDLCYQGGRWEEGVQWLRRYIAADEHGQSVDDAFLKLGLCLHHLQRHDEAVAAYRTLLTEHAQSSHAGLARLELGRSLLALGQGGEAKEEFGLAAAQDDAELAARAQNQLAVMASESGDLATAAELFADSARKGDGAAAADAWFGLGSVLLSAGKYTEAAAALEEFAREHADDPRTGEARAQRAIAMSRAGGGAAALRAITEAVAASEGLSAALRDSLAFEEAATLRAAGRTEEAESRMRTLADSGADPSMRVSAALEVARHAFEAERFEAAAEVLRGIGDELESDSVSAELREHGTYQRAAAEFKLGEYKAAEEGFEGFIQKYPESKLAASARLLSGESLFRLGRHRRAVEQLRAAIAASLPEPDEQTARLRLGESLAALQDWKASEEAFAAMLERFPRADVWFQARFGRGWAKENQGRYDEAMADYAAVVEKHSGPTAARAQFQIGECLFAQGKHRDAVRELLKVDILYAYPEWSAAALYEAGRCFEALGEPEKAAEQYRSVRERHGQTRWDKLAAQRLIAVGGGNG